MVYLLGHNCIFCSRSYDDCDASPCAVRATLPAVYSPLAPDPTCPLPYCKDEKTMDKGKDGKWRCWRCGTEVK